MLAQQDSILLLLISVGIGYLGTLVLTWFLQHSPRNMLGRMMNSMNLLMKPRYLVLKRSRK